MSGPAKKRARKATAAKKAAPVSKTMTRPVVEVAQPRKAARVPHITFVDAPVAGPSRTRLTEEPVEAMAVEEEEGASDEARDTVSNEFFRSSEMLMFLYFAVESTGGAAPCCQG